MLPQVFGINVPLNLIWLAGNGQIEELKKEKYREEVQKINIFEAKALILKHTRTQNNTYGKTLGLKKVSILVTGLVIINELQVDYFYKKMKDLYHELQSEIHFGIHIISSKYNILQENNSRNLDITFQNKREFGKFGSFKSGKGGVNLLPRDESFLSAQRMELYDLPNEPMMVTEMDVDVDFNTIRTRRRRAKDADGVKLRLDAKSDKQPSKSKRLRSEIYEEFPNQDDIWALLWRRAKNLNPYAHTILDLILPPQPPIEGTDFCNVGEIEDPQFLLSFQSEADASKTIRGQVQLSLLGTEIPPDNLPSNLKNVMNRTSEYEHSKPRTTRKKKHKGLLIDEKIEISDEDIRHQIFLNSKTCLEAESTNLFHRMPEVIRHATYLDAFNSYFPERKKLTLETCPIAIGDELIMLVGKKKIAKDMKANFIDTYDSYPKFPKGKRHRKTEQARLQISDPSNLKSILSPENPHTDEKSINQQLSKNSEEMSSAGELVMSKDLRFVRAASPQPIIELIDLLAPPSQRPASAELIVGRIDLGTDLQEEYSPPPILAEAATKTVDLQPTFREMVLPGKSRQFASHYFMTLLNLQKDRKLALVQQKSFGTIQITQIEPTYSPRNPIYAYITPKLKLMNFTECI